MKYIVSYIEDDRLGRVLQELDRNEIYLRTISRIQSSGAPSSPPMFRLEIAVNDNYVRPALDAILSGGKSGADAAGKIFIQPLEQCIRIRTGEGGSVAIG
jgi:nitrogen regulatory protein P-II 2